MGKFSKRIKLNENHSIQYEITEDGYIPLHTIIILDSNDYQKVIKFSRWDDYSFYSWNNIKNNDYDKLKKESYSFDKNHPLYVPLLNLLNGEEELIIDDDATAELNQKYMKIYHKKDKINISFVNELKNDQDIEKFNIFIKNIARDGRSKIDYFEKDTKERLHFFFQEVLSIFKEEHHQISIEEFLVQHNDLSLEESKKYVKKFNFK